MLALIAAANFRPDGVNGALLIFGKKTTIVRAVGRDPKGGVVAGILPISQVGKEFLAFIEIDEDLVEGIFVTLGFQALQELLGICNRSNNKVSGAYTAATGGIAFLAEAIACAGIEIDQ
jgi:hypothetical protein